MFEVKIETDNAAFDDAGRLEIARILRELADRVEERALSGRVTDINGNTVGTYGVQGRSLT